MAPELFAVSYAGAPKIVVTDFVDEVRLRVPRELLTSSTRLVSISA